MKCPSCGNDNSPGTAICEWCGSDIAGSPKRETMLEPAAAPAAPPVHDPGKTRKTMSEPDAAPPPNPGTPPAPPAPAPRDPAGDYFDSPPPSRPALHDVEDPFRPGRAGTPTTPVAGGSAPAKARTIIDSSAAGGATRRIEGALFLYAAADDPGAIVPLYSGRSTLGRDPSRDVVIDDGRVSSEHGFLLLRPDGGAYVDTSTNGTLVDGQVVHLSQVEIRHGSVLVLGNVHAVFAILPTRPFEEW